MRNNYAHALQEGNSKNNWNKITMENLAKINQGFGKIANETEHTLQKESKGEIDEATQAEANTIKWFSTLPQGYPEDITQKYSRFYIPADKKRLIKSFREEECYYLRVISEVMMKDIIHAYLQTITSDVRVFNTTAYDDTYHGIDAIVETTDASGTHYTGIDVCISNKSGLAAKKLGIDNQEFWYSDDHSDSEIVGINYESRRTTVKRGSEFESRAGYTETMPRVIKDFNPQTIAFVFEQYLRDIQNGIDPSLGVWGNYKKTKAKVANRRGNSSILTEVPMTEFASQVMGVVDFAQAKKSSHITQQTTAATVKPRERTRKILSLKK